MGRHVSYETKIKQKRGTGIGKDYIPWHQVGESIKLSFPDQKMRGNGHRILGVKTQRIHHLLSSNERFIFMMLDLNKKVIDIREQFPLELTITKKIALDLGIRYPYVSENHVLTSDFLITYRDGSEEVITFKPLNHLSERQLELFQIERTYWESKGIHWKLMTDQETPKNPTLIKNYIGVYNSVVDFHQDKITTSKIQQFYQYMINNIDEYGNCGLVDYCHNSDLNLAFEEGLSLRVVKILIGKKILKVDMNESIFSNSYYMKSIEILNNVKHINKSNLAA